MILTSTISPVWIIIHSRVWIIVWSHRHMPRLPVVLWLSECRLKDSQKDGQSENQNNAESHLSD